MNQKQVVFELMSDGEWRTIEQIEMETGFKQTTISSRLREFRTPKGGSHIVHKKLVGEHEYSYKLELNPMELI